jgi:hypothetical protein
LICLYCGKENSAGKSTAHGEARSDEAIQKGNWQPNPWIASLHSQWQKAKADCFALTALPFERLSFASNFTFL